MQALGQEVVGGRVLTANLAAWATQLLYFKVDVTDAAPRKHQVEVEVAEPISHLSKYARSPMMVTQTTYDPDGGVFVSECDRGKLTAAIRELQVDSNTLKRAVFRARELFRDGGGPGGPGGGGAGGGSSGTPGGGKGCPPAELEKLRRDLLNFLAGKQVDICRVWARIQCCCASGGFGGGNGNGDGDPWVLRPPSGLEILAIPTRVDYRIDYTPSSKVSTDRSRSTIRGGRSCSPSSRSSWRWARRRQLPPTSRTGAMTS
jgi:hypothetical protein